MDACWSSWNNFHSAKNIQLFPSVCRLNRRRGTVILIQISPPTFWVSPSRNSIIMTSFAIFSDADILISAPDWAIIKELNSRVGSNASASGRYPPSSAVMVIHPLVSKRKKKEAKHREIQNIQWCNISLTRARIIYPIIYIYTTHIKSTREGATFARAFDAREGAFWGVWIFFPTFHSKPVPSRMRKIKASVVKITQPLLNNNTTQISSAQLNSNVCKIEDIEKYAADKRKAGNKYVCTQFPPLCLFIWSVVTYNFSFSWIIYYYVFTF